VKLNARFHIALAARTAAVATTGKGKTLSDQAIVIESERLTLRPLRLSDADDLYQYQSNPEIVRYIPWPERTREQVVEALEKYALIGSAEPKENGEFLLLGWELKSTGQVIGQSNLGLKSVNDQCADIGWVTHQDFQRQGYAFEATHALMKYAFANFPLHRIVADIDTRNPESAAMAEKLGMRREGEFKDAEFFKGAWCDMWLYAILKSEFHA
jgi:aminoglycoside 6'-N-acetyltransferase